MLMLPFLHMQLLRRLPHIRLPSRRLGYCQHLWAPLRVFVNVFHQALNLARGGGVDGRIFRGLLLGENVRHQVVVPLDRRHLQADSVGVDMQGRELITLLGRCIADTVEKRQLGSQQWVMPRFPSPN